MQAAGALAAGGAAVDLQRFEDASESEDAPPPPPPPQPEAAPGGAEFAGSDEEYSDEDEDEMAAALDWDFREGASPNALLFGGCAVRGHVTRLRCSARAAPRRRAQT
jgi:hypothetical protein